MSAPTKDQLPPETQEKILEFWRLLYGEREGFFTVATLDHTAPEKTGWRERHFRWPDGAEKAAGYALSENVDGRSVYQSVLLRKAGRRILENVETASWLFSDLDGANLERVSSFPPSVLIESSPGRRQGYWPLTEPIPAARAASLLRRLVTATGGDEGAKDLTRVLRIPHTISHKYAARPAVEILQQNGRTYTAKEFEASLPALPGAVQAKRLDRKELRDLLHAAPGERNEKLKSWIWTALTRGADADMARELALEANAVYSSPLEQDEVEEIVRKAVSNYARKRPPAGLRPEPAGFSVAELMARPRAEPDFIVKPIMPKGLTLLAGKPKKGKSALARSLALAAAMGGRALGQIPTRQGAVLYLAYEDGPAILQDRYGRLLQGSKPPESLKVYPSLSPWPRTDQGGLERLDEWAAEHPDLRLLVVDTLRYFRKPRKDRGNDIYEEDYQAVAELKAFADAHEVGVLVLTHSRKAGSDEPLDLVLGTTGLTAAADTVWVLTRGHGRGEAELYVTGRDIEEATLALRFDRLLLSWMLLGDAEIYRRGQERQEVMKILAQSGGSASPRNVAQATGKTYGAVNKMMWTMANDGLIVHAKRGRYALPEPALRSGTTEALEALVEGESEEVERL